MSDHKMQVIVKSYDKTELRIEISAEQGIALKKKLEDNQIIKSKLDELLNIRETLGDVIFQPMDETDKQMYTDAAFNMLDKLIKSVKGARD